MPHTSHRRPRPSAHTGTRTTKTKHGRTLLSSADGWTHVLPSTYLTTASSAASASASTPSPLASLAPLNDALPTSTLEPAEAPPHTTDETALATHARYVSRLRDTAFWEATDRQIRAIVRPSGPHTTATTAVGDDDDARRVVIRKAILFGLGSPTGLCRGGMVDRRRVSGWQLAWFVEVVRLVEALQGHPLEEKLAQEPLYNAHDIRLHKALGIEVLDSPEAFERMTNETLVFAPGAEREVLRRIFEGDQEEQRRPVVFVGNLMDGQEGGGEEARMKRWELPRFEEEDESVFWGMGIYWGGEVERKVEGGGDDDD
ncbi:MAG: hypothetical protein Q9160_005358 [Pyrenula sp. 1 TL-2023]